jgi:hypothetical protein
VKTKTDQMQERERRKSIPEIYLREAEADKNKK